MRAPCGQQTCTSAHKPAHPSALPQQRTKSLSDVGVLGAKERICLQLIVQCAWQRAFPLQRRHAPPRCSKSRRPFVNPDRRAGRVPIPWTACTPLYYARERSSTRLQSEERVGGNAPKFSKTWQGVQVHSRSDGGCEEKGRGGHLGPQLVNLLLAGLQIPVTWVHRNRPLGVGLSVFVCWVRLRTRFVPVNAPSQPDRPRKLQLSACFVTCRCRRLLIPVPSLNASCRALTRRKATCTSLMSGLPQASEVQRLQQVQIRLVPLLLREA